MERFIKVLILLIVIDMVFKSDMVEGGRGLQISKKQDDQPRNFPGFPNWNFPGKQNPGQADNLGFPDIPGLPFFGFPPVSPGDDNSAPLNPGLFPLLPYFTNNPPKYCIPLVICIPLPDLFPPPQDQPPQAAPVLPPPDQGPLAPTVQPSPTNPSPFQPPPAQW